MHPRPGAHVLAENSGFQFFFAPLAEAGGSGAFGRAGYRVVQAFVLGDHHVDHALSHGISGTLSADLRLKGFKGDLLIADRLAEDLRKNLRHIVAGDILRAENGNILLAGPGVIEQPLGSDGSNVASSAVGIFASPGPGCQRTCPGS